jgi:hypothetical protein
MIKFYLHPDPEDDDVEDQGSGHEQLEQIPTNPE